MVDRASAGGLVADPAQFRTSSHGIFSRKVKLAGLIVLITVCLLAAALGAAVGCADLLLTVCQEPRRADMIVVLGGVSKRAEKAAELYHQGYAPRILVAGREEAVHLGKRLLEAGVPKQALVFEAGSRNTYENAAFSLPLLQRSGAKSLLLVTSWYHSRRAAAVFASFAGMPEIVSVPTEAVTIGRIINENAVFDVVLREYLKIVGYWIRYGIPPVDIGRG